MENLMGVDDLAEYLKVNKQTVYNWVSRKEIPFIKIGDLVRFEREDISLWLRNKTFRPDTIEYRGYEIQAFPYQIPQSKKWVLNIYIFRYEDFNMKSRNFSSNHQFNTRAEAVKHCFEFGMRIIDGEIENCSVVDM